MAGELGGVFPEVCFLENNCYSHTLHTDSTGGRGLEIASFQVLEDGAFFIKCEFTMFRCCSQRLRVNLEDTAPQLRPCVGFSLMSGVPFCGYTLNSSSCVLSSSWSGMANEALHPRITECLALVSEPFSHLSSPPPL